MPENAVHKRQKPQIDSEFEKQIKQKLKCDANQFELNTGNNYTFNYSFQKQQAIVIRNTFTTPDSSQRVIPLTKTQISDKKEIKTNFDLKLQGANQHKNVFFSSPFRQFSNKRNSESIANIDSNPEFVSSMERQIILSKLESHVNLKKETTGPSILSEKISTSQENLNTSSKLNQTNSNESEYSVSQKLYYSHRVINNHFNNSDLQYSHTESETSEKMKSETKEYKAGSNQQIFSARVIRKGSSGLAQSQNSGTSLKADQPMPGITAEKKKSIFEQLESNLMTDSHKSGSSRMSFKESPCPPSKSLFENPESKKRKAKSSSQSQDENCEMFNLNEDSLKFSIQKHVKSPSEKNPFFNFKENFEIKKEESPSQGGDLQGERTDSDENICSLRFLKKNKTIKEPESDDKSEEYVGITWEEKKKQIAANSPYGKLRSYTIRQIIIKVLTFSKKDNLF